MGRSKGRRGPSDPQEIAARRAEERAFEREAARVRMQDPANWEVANDTLDLPMGQAVDVTPGSRSRVVRFKRADPFDTLYKAKAMSQGQHQAAQRLFKLWCESMGVKTEDSRPMLELIQCSGSAEIIPQRQIDARARYQLVLSYVGLSTARLLDVLMQPSVMCGSVVIWRAEVARITAEKDKHAQAAVVRQACDNLRLAFGVYDLRLARGEIEEALRRRELDAALVASEG